MKANYDAIAHEWSQHRNSLPAKDKELFDHFIESLPDKTDILDLGCGSGIPIAKQLAEKGFSVRGIDRSQQLLNIARANVPNVDFQKHEIEDYEIGETYAGIVLWDAIFHIPREEHRSILEKIYSSLSAGSLLIVSSGGSPEDLPPFTDIMFEVEFFYDAYTPANFLSLCEDIGFKLEKYKVLNEPDGGRDKGRIGAVLSAI